MRSTLLLTLGFLGAPALAETPAPDYYLDALFAVSTAELLSNFCTGVALDPVLANAALETVLADLATDGIRGDDILALGGVEAGVGARQDAFMARYELAEPSEERICAAAQSEIAEGSAIGGFLVQSSE
ncbi:MAG: DUF5333 family protein [Pseudomonadota bacterium]